MMRVRHFSVLLLVFACGFVAVGKIQGQASAATEARKIVRRTIPAYPDIAKRMNLGGTVKVLATVAPDGTVRTVQPMGGSPVLIQAAEDAVYKWKFVPAGAESKEVLELHFNSQ
jgi:TonB family protein